MATGPFDNDVWDEQTWEEYIDQLEEQTRRLRRLMTPHETPCNPRWLFLLQNYEWDTEVVDTYVIEELIFEEVYFGNAHPDEFEDWDAADEEGFFYDMDTEEWDEEYPDDDELPYFEFEDEDLEGEEWKKLVEDDMHQEEMKLDAHYLYRESRRISALLVEGARSINTKHYSSTFMRFVEAMLKTTTKIVAGHTLGFERMLLGGNIVYHKKALHWSNYALELLREMRDSPLFDLLHYRKIHEAVFELRNDLGVYVQELRERL